MDEAHVQRAVPEVHGSADPLQLDWPAAQRVDEIARVAVGALGKALGQHLPVGLAERIAGVHGSVAPAAHRDHEVPERLGRGARGHRVFEANGVLLHRRDHPFDLRVQQRPDARMS